MKHETGIGLILLGGGAAAGVLGWHIFRWTRKAAVSVSIIGGTDKAAMTTVIGSADGPTAVFLAGRLPSAQQMGVAAGGLLFLFLLIAGICIRKYKKGRKDAEGR